MIDIFFAIILIIIFILSGKIIPALKKIIQIATKVFLKFLSYIGITFTKKEKKINISKEFKNVYKDIKIVKESKSNLKQISYIDWVYFSVFIVTVALIVLNLNIVSGNYISNFLYDTQIIKLSNTVTDMNTFFTAGTFSILSFSFGKILYRWKETKIYRIDKKNKKLKLKAKHLFTTKELLEVVREKDDAKYKELK